ncbi:ATP-binding cassette domain-containing protein [Candidatus Gracilibacteria bacterium]|nr:ATP-binding cassette domain-containing protein [Candidatus Gracilibacteria bacterium]
MNQITTRKLKKIFKVEKKGSGFINRVKGLFFPKYIDIEAVLGIDLEIEAGEKIAFLGPNGAGKSTTIKMLTGILSRTSGDIDILGFDPQKDRNKLVYHIGAVFGQTSRLWYHLTAKDTFLLFSKIFDVKYDDYQKRLDYLVEEFSIKEFLNTPVRKLSLGQRMRCEIVASLIHKPKIIFLDEPTIGLDILAKQKLRDIVNKINKEENTTIFLTSHDLGDVEEICDRVIIINYGKVIYDGNIKELKKNHIKTKNIKIKFEKNYEKIDFGDDITILKSNGNYYELQIKNEKNTIGSFLETVSKKYPFEDITITEPSMEDIIKTFY